MKEERLAAKERPRSGSLVVPAPTTLSFAASAASPQLPASPALAATSSALTTSPLLTATAAGSAGVVIPFTLPSTAFFTLPPTIASYRVVRAFLSDLYLPIVPPLSPLSLINPRSSSSSSLLPPVFTPSPHPPLFLLDNSKLRRALKLLDRVPSRETHKVGLLYIAEGQDEQSSILGNEGGSVAYERFKEGLGWTVKLRSHRGFMGGLEGNGGEESVYWCSSSAELMWHVVTLMPTVRGEDGRVDAVQLAKKRQVGNDYVHVVWSEHGREYRPNTISSQFNHVHIVIYPIHSPSPPTSSPSPSTSFSTSAPPSPPSPSPSPLPLSCRVQIFSKPSVPPFGPLQPHMVVPFTSLPALVRLTALNANRAIRWSTAGYAAPYPTRKGLLEEVIAKAGLRVEDQVGWRRQMTRDEDNNSNSNDSRLAAKEPVTSSIPE